jgi:futalosine hydrolase
MHILLAAATSFEIQPTLDFLATRPKPHRISTLVAGVGSLATTWSLARQIGRDRPDLILQAGIAGSFTRKPLGDVLAVSDETLADLGVWEAGRFNTLFDLHLADPDQPPFTAGRLVNPYRTLLDLTGLEQVSSITVNEITTHSDRISWYRENLSAHVESMEGGALHYVALQERIAFLQIRSISNDIGVRDKSKWNIPLAIRQLNDRLISLLKELNQHDIRILTPINHSA